MFIYLPTDFSKTNFTICLAFALHSLYIADEEIRYVLKEKIGPEAWMIWDTSVRTSSCLSQLRCRWVLPTSRISLKAIALLAFLSNF